MAECTCDNQNHPPAEVDLSFPPLSGLSYPAVAAVACAVALLAWVWRGRRVDDHPVCRRCGYDLHGRTARDLACWECGADLTRRGAVRPGHRRRNPALVIASLAMLLFSAGWLGRSVLAGAGVNWATSRPLSWVMEEANSADGRVRDAALAELARRLRAGELAPSREQALVELALAHQADWSQTWVPGWGELIEAARGVGKASDEQWRRYQVQLVSFALVPVSGQVRNPHDVWFEICRGPDRTSARPSFRFQLAVYSQELDVSGHRLARRYVMPRDPSVIRDLRLPAHENLTPVAAFDIGAAGRSSGHPAIARVTTAGWPREPSLDALVPGPQTAKLSLVFRPIRLNSGTWRQQPGYSLEPGERRVEVEAKWTLASPEPPIDSTK